MKRVIKNKVYNTETAKAIKHRFTADIPNNDFRFESETLFRKKTGEYFLAGEGGVFTKYATHHCNSGAYGENIIPMTYEEANEWSKQYMTEEEYSAEFGEPSEDETIRVAAEIPETIKAKLDETARNEKKSVAAIIRDILVERYSL